MSPADLQHGLAVGQVLGTEHTPAATIIGRLEELVWSGTSDAAAAALRDPRRPEQEWNAALRRELASTLSWAARRLLARAGRGRSGTPAWNGTGNVLSLLPRHGHAVHVIRRALPFALCGVPTTVAGHAHQRDEVHRVVRVLRRLLDLPGEMLGQSSGTARQTVAERSADDLVVVTGAPSSVAAVRAGTAATVLGATGSCVLMLGTDAAALERVARALGAHDQPGSCTRMAGSWVAREGSTRWQEVGPGGTRGALDREVVLRDTHPTALYRLAGDLGGSPQEIDGYICLAADESGAAGTLTGFARDPRQGWPGDFLI
jgi:hypothetical protein